MAGDGGGNRPGAGDDLADIDAQQRAHLRRQKASGGDAGGDGIGGLEILCPVQGEALVGQHSAAGLVQAVIVDVERHLPVAETQLADADGEIAHLRLHADADIVHRQVGQHGDAEIEIDARHAQRRLRIDAEAGRITQGLHVDQGHDIRHRPVGMQAEDAHGAMLVQRGDHGMAAPDHQIADPPGGEVGGEIVAGEQGRAVDAGEMGQAGKIVGLDALHGETQCQRFGRQHRLVGAAGSEIHLELRRTQSAGEDVLVDPGARARRGENRPVGQQGARRQSRDLARQDKARRFHRIERDGAAGLQRQGRRGERRLGHVQPVRRGRIGAVEAEPGKAHRAGEDARRIEGEPAGDKIPRQRIQLAVGAIVQGAVALELGLDLAGVEIGACHREMVRQAVEMARQFQQIDMQHPAPEQGEGHVALGGGVEIGAGQLAAAREGEARGQPGDHRQVFQRGEFRRVRRQRAQVQAGDGQRAGDRPVLRRQGDAGGEMRFAPGNFDLGVEVGGDRRSLRPHVERGARRHQEQAGGLVENGQARIAHGEALQRRGAVALVDDVAELLDDVVAALVGFDAEANAAIVHPHQRQLHADQGDAPHFEMPRQERPRRQVDIGLGGLGDDAAARIEHARAQDHQVDAALVPAPFDRGLVVFQGDAGQRLADGVGDGAAQRPQ